MFGGIIDEKTVIPKVEDLAIGGGRLVLVPLFQHVHRALTLALVERQLFVVEHCSGKDVTLFIALMQPMYVHPSKQTIISHYTSRLRFKHEYHCRRIQFADEIGQNEGEKFLQHQKYPSKILRGV